MNKHLLLFIEGTTAAGAAAISALEFFTPLVNFGTAAIGLFIALKSLKNYNQSKKNDTYHGTSN